MTRLSHVAFISTLVGALCGAPLALANGSRLPSQDAQIVARGNTGVASVDTSAAIYYNPAGLANVQRAEVSSSAYFAKPKTEFTSAATGRTVEEQSDGFVQPSFFAALPIRGDVTLGFGVYSPFGESTDWPVTSGFAGLATFNEILYITGAVSAGWKPTRALAVGASFQFSHARVDLNRLTRLAPGVITRFSFEGRDNALSGNVGLQWQVAPAHTLGLMYQRKTDFDFDGTASLAGVLSREGQVGWVFPDNVAVGWQWAFAPEWRASASVDWTNWERLNTLHLQAGPLSTAVPLNWMASAYYNFGVTRQVTAEWSWSAGYIFSENSVPDSTLSPTLPDVDRHLLTGGVAWKGARWEVHAAIQQGLRSKRTKSGPAPDGLGGSATGTYRNEIFSGALQAIRRF